MMHKSLSGFRSVEARFALAGAAILVALSAAAQAPRPSSVSVEMTLAKGPDTYEDTEYTVRYEAAERDGWATIRPQGGYLRAFRARGPIDTAGWWEGPPFFSLHFPVLEFTLSNNSTRAVSLANVVLDVRESSLDAFPLLLVCNPREPDRLFNIHFLNEGWGPVEDAWIRFDIFKDDEAPDFDKAFPNLSTLPYKVGPVNFSDSYRVSIEEHLGAQGMDTATISALHASPIDVGDAGDRIRRALGPFEGRTAEEDQRLWGDAFPWDREVAVAGLVSFRGKTASGQAKDMSLKFSTLVPISPPRARDECETPPSGSYETRLEAGGSNYRVTVPAAHSIGPGRTQSFALRLGADKSSIHYLQARLVFGDGTELPSPPIYLSLFVPRSRGESLAPERVTPPPLRESPRGSFALQFSAISVRNRHWAESFGKVVAAKTGLTAWLMNTEDGRFVRVLGGHFETREAADAVRGQLVKHPEFRECFVRSLK